MINNKITQLKKKKKSIQPKIVAQQTINALLSLPNELQATIGRNLHGPDLVNALGFGLQVDDSTRLRAQHSFIWSFFLSNEEFSEVERALKTYGNIFIIGHNLQQLYKEAFKKPKSTTIPIHLLLAWKAEEIRIQK
jgi:hypothetical protein